MAQDRAFLDAMIRTAYAAGEAAMRIYESDFSVYLKDDHSPVTAADHASETIILAGLAALRPDIPVIAEEAAAAGRIPETGARFFLVDPLDGTKEFLKKNGEFTVNIALIEEAVPVFGLIYAPALRQLYLTLSGEQAVEARLPQHGAAPDTLDFKPMRTRLPGNAFTCVVSRSHMSAETEAFLRERNVTQTANIGSSLKFCLVASGQADIYPRYAPTWEWDTAAGHAILNAAGGCVKTTDGAPLLYGKRSANFLNPGFIAWAQADMAQS